MLDGRVPYRDFVLTQMPLLPYAYALWTAVVGEGWVAARLLSVACAVALGTILFRYCAVRFGTFLALAVTAAYVTSTLVFTWFAAVKTQPLSTLLLFGAFALATPVGPASGARWAAAGAALGLAIDTRLLLAAAVPVFLWWAWRGADGRRRALPSFGAGLAVALLPSVAFLLVEPARFTFDVLGYHASRSPGGLVGDFAQKARVAANLLGVGTPDGAIPQFLLLTVAAGATAVVALALGARIPPALVLAAVVGVASFLPTPTYAQYLGVAVPFLLVGVLDLPARAGRAGRGGSAVRAVTVGVVGVYALLGVRDYVHHVRAVDYGRVDTVEQVAAEVDALTRPEERVLASWPGYLYGSGAVSYPGLENDYAPQVAAGLSADRAHELRLAQVEDVEGAIETRSVRIVVLKRWHALEPQPDWEGALRRGRYEVAAEIDGVLVYRSP